MGYLSRVEPKHKVRPNDFDGLTALRFNDDKPNQKDRKRDVALWDKYIDVTPEDFLSIIQSWFYVDLDVDVKLTRNGVMTVTLNDPQGLFIECFFSADLKQKIFSKKSTIRLMSKNEGQGLATAWLACQVELYAALGASQLTHEATLIGGAHKWARMGMHIDFEKSDPDKLARLSRNMKAKLEAFRKIGAIDEDKYKELLPYTDLNNEDDLVKLIANDFIIPDSLVTPDGVNITRDFSNVLTEEIQQNPIHEDEKVKNVVEEKLHQLVKIWNRVQPRQKPITFAQFALFQEDYIAKVDFGDTDQMEAMGRYARGWKFGIVS
jgi:hypothetical protein